MPHEIERILAAAGRGLWAIDQDKATELVAVLALRAGGHHFTFEDDEVPRRREYAAETVQAGRGVIHVLPLHGSIFPRANMLAAMSGGVSLEQFGRVFGQVARDPEASAIVLDVDSPGGMVDLVPETAALIRGARREGRPIVAVANTTMASAAYWLGSVADEIVVTPSARIGSIGVYTMHDDMSERLKIAGVTRTLISEGPRKVEGHPFGPLDDVSRAAIQSQIRETYGAFTSDVAKGRGVDVSVVRADPVTDDAHFGGGRAYGAREAVRLGMADRIATLDETLARLAKGGPVRSPGMARRRLAML